MRNAVERATVCRSGDRKGAPATLADRERFLSGMRT
jgi:hypothetical protein